MKRLDRTQRVRTGPKRPVAETLAREASLAIAAIGVRGEGVAEGAAAGGDGPVYVPFTLPGERVRAMVAGGRGAVIAIETPSADRVAAPCALFGRCGGCQLQHWADAPYLAWKHAQVVQALARRQVTQPVAPVRVAWGEGRRRAAFHAQRVGAVVRFGFIERGGGRIAAMDACPALSPGLHAALPQLRALAAAFAPARSEIVLQCLETETGLDVAIKGAGRIAGFDRAALERAAAAADAADLARLSFDGEPLAVRRVPRVSMGRARVAPPPGAFLQATRAGEETLGALVTTAIAGAERVLDLFSGIGTFALRAADVAEVHAVEGDTDMLTALKAAADAVGGLRGVTVERRDLLRAPLAAMEMKRFDTIIFDPPRSGAKLQAEQIAASKARKVVAVSCDPATFARDVKVLMDAGFALTDVTPVDQFRWTPHVEVVGVLTR